MEKTEWVSATDADGNLQGTLVLDQNNNGLIETRDILNIGGNAGLAGQASNATDEAQQATQNAALQRNNANWLDANGDGVLNASDPAFAAIKLWVDVQSNGLVDQGEMQSLSSIGVTSINLKTGEVACSATDALGNTVEGHTDMTALTLSSETSGVKATRIMNVQTDGTLSDSGAGDVIEHEGYQGQTYTAATTDSAGNVTGGGWGKVREQTYEHQALRIGDWEGTADQEAHRHGGGNVAGAPTETSATGATDLGAPIELANVVTQSTITENDSRVVSDAPDSNTPATSGQVLGQTNAQTVIAAGDIRIRSDSPLTAQTATVAQRPSAAPLAFVPIAQSSAQNQILAVTEGMIQSAQSSFFGLGANGGLGALTAVGLGAVQGAQAVERPAPVSVTLTAESAAANLAVSSSNVFATTYASTANDGNTTAGTASIALRQVDSGSFSTAVIAPTPVLSPSAQITSPLSSSTQSATASQAPITATNLSATVIVTAPQVASTPGVLTTPSSATESTAANLLTLDYPVVQGEILSGTEDVVIRLTQSELLANDSSPNALADPTQSALTITALGAPLHGQVSLVNGEVLFAPDLNFHGTASFTYTVTDQFGLSSTATATLQIAAVNDAPVTQGEASRTAEDTALVFTQAQLLDNDSDVDVATDAQVLSISRVGQATHGTVALDSQGLVRFTPDANYHGPAQFTYWVSDGSAATGAGAETPATVSLMIASVNDIPVATGETVNTNEDNNLLFDPATLLANDTDLDMVADSQVLSITAVANATHGAVALVTQSDGSQRIAFTPETNYFGLASYQYTVSDGKGGEPIATVVINLAEANDSPEANADDLGTTLEDNALHISMAKLLANDGDVDSQNASWGSVNDVLSVSAVGNATHGAVALVQLADGSSEVVFTPDANYHGPASFVYQVRDLAGAVSQAVATFQISAVNDLPVSNGETIETFEDQMLLIAQSALLQNDTDADAATDGQVLSISAVSKAQHGTANLQSDGTIAFVPDANFYGTASFDYTVSDGTGGTATATAVLQIANVNDAPAALGETIQSAEDAVLTLTAASLLQNDTDIDNPHSDLKIARVQSSTHGSVSLNANGNVVFTPEANYNNTDTSGAATFNYWVKDSAGQESTAVTARIMLTAANDAPVSRGETVTGASEDAVFRIDRTLLLANDTDIDDVISALSLSWVGSASGGAVSLDANGNVVFTPNANFNGNASFSYRVRDAAGLESATVQAIIPVAAVNDVPVAVDDQFQTYNNATMSIGFNQLVGNDFDVDGNALTVAAVRDRANGHAQIVNGQVQFAANVGFTGTAYFDYLCDDGLGGQAWATAQVTVVEPPNRYPTIDLSNVSINWYNSQYVEVWTMTVSFNINDDGNRGATSMQLVSAVERNGGWWPDASPWTTYGLSGGSGSIFITGPITTRSGYVGDGDTYVEWTDQTYFNDYRSTWILTDDRGLQNTWHFDFYDYGINSWEYKGYADHSGYYTPPVVLDLNGNGLHFTSLQDSHVSFDVNYDGFNDKLAWAGNDDGVLVWDKDHNGRISDASEFSFQNLKADAQTDLEGLQALDTNHNGVLDAGDEKFAEFGVWQDANGNGVTDAGEFKTLHDLGIASINLQSDAQMYDAGTALANSPTGETDVTIMGTTTFTRTDGSTGTAADAMFAFEAGSASAENQVVADHAYADAQVAEINRQALVFNQMCNTAMQQEDSLGFIPINPDLHSSADIVSLLQSAVNDDLLPTSLTQASTNHDTSQANTAFALRQAA